MNLTDSTIFYFCWALIIDSVILTGASFFRAIHTAALWVWLSATILAYFCYESVMPVRMNIRVDLLYLWPLFLFAALACIVRSCLRR